MANQLQKANFGAGCFWNVEAIFRMRKGVVKTEVGYEGGHVDHPTYEQVCSHTTGHAETVQVTYNLRVITYEDLLKIFFDSHDPTQVDRQGPDIGDNYRSVIFYHDDKQRTAAEKAKFNLEQSGKYKKPIVTQIVPAQTFWRGEDSHQQYLKKRGLGVCY